MRSILLMLALLCAVVPVRAQEPGDGPKQAELIRSTTGRTLGPNGLASGTMPLKKGAIYPVLERKMAFVVLAVGGARVVVNQTEVQLSPLQDVPPPVAGGFAPGQIVLVSAKYTIEGNQPRNVKNRLSKLVPAGVLTEPVQILVTDGLSSAAEAQDGVARGVITDVGPGTAIVTIQGTRKNILTVEYLFNGQKRTKQAVEGTYLVLP